MGNEFLFSVSGIVKQDPKEGIRQAGEKSLPRATIIIMDGEKEVQRVTASGVTWDLF